jgi:hypothetical protein
VARSKGFLPEREFAFSGASFAPRFSPVRFGAERISETRRPAEIGKEVPTSATEKQA